MNKFVIATSALLILAGCSTAPPNGPVDENILVHLPIPDSDWSIRSGERGNESIRMWEKENELFKITINHNRFRPEPAQFRLGMDEVAEKNLTTDFHSKELKEGSVNNYPMILWQTEATLKSGSKALSLLLYIKGNDATYLVDRRWIDMQVPDEEKQLWINYMLSISVCDNRFPEHKSPKMEEQWPGFYFRTDVTNGIKQ